MKKYLFIGPIVFLLVWYGVTAFRFVDPFLVPGPFVVFSTLMKLCTTRELWFDVGVTLYRTLTAFLLAAALGLPLGLFLGVSKKTHAGVAFLVDFFRSMPATAMFPLFLLLFGIGDLSKITVTAFSCGLVILFNAASGIMHAKKARLLAARVMGATRMQTFCHVLFWESLPQTFVGLRSAVSLALIIIVVTEMFIGSVSGLGHRIIDAQITYEIPSMYADILLVGVMGYLLNLVFAKLEHRFVHWAGK